MHKQEISYVRKNSIADQLGVSSGDFLISINGQPVKDFFDYQVHMYDETLLVEIEKTPDTRDEDGETWELEIEKEFCEDIGISFIRRCKNKCIFCFVDQQPKGMRDSLYVKDDDPFMSAILGNYVTLSNLNEDEIDKLMKIQISPLRISVHTTDMQLREKMMGSKFAANLLDILHKLSPRTELHFQIVLCKGVNDNAALTKSILDLYNLGKNAKSLSVVPAGLTCHREDLYPLTPFSATDALEVIQQVEDLGLKNFVYLSDEWYLLAGLPLPNYKSYNDFPQLDNGVGMIRLFEREFKQKLKRDKSRPSGGKTIGIITGKAAGRFMRFIAAKFMEKHPAAKIEVFEIENCFFGENITVSGLLTGGDIIRQVKNKHNVSAFFLPENAFRAGVKEKVMLDGVTIDELARELGVPVYIGSTHGGEFYEQLKI